MDHPGIMFLVPHPKWHLYFLEWRKIRGEIKKNWKRLFPGRIWVSGEEIGILASYLVCTSAKIPTGRAILQYRIPITKQENKKARLTFPKKYYWLGAGPPMHHKKERPFTALKPRRLRVALILFAPWSPPPLQKTLCSTVPAMVFRASAKRPWQMTTTNPIV